MPSLQQQLARIVGAKVIVWMNHPELRTMNGTLADVEADHIGVMVETHTYFVPYNAIIAVRAAGSAG
jgi:ribosome maturation factor RimP